VDVDGDEVVDGFLYIRICPKSRRPITKGLLRNNCYMFKLLLDEWCSSNRHGIRDVAGRFSSFLRR